MRPDRFSLAGMMATLLLIGAGLAGLARPTDLFARSMFTVTLTILLLSLLGVAFSRGRDRCFWVGFALLGWSCVAIRFLPWFVALGESHLMGFGSLKDLAIAVHPIDESTAIALGDTPEAEAFRNAEYLKIVCFQDILVAMMVLVLAWIGGLCARSFDDRRQGTVRESGS